MCGIYGELSISPNPDARRDFADSAERALRHRGPDGSGLFSDEHCLLGHTRLAVLDPTDASAQPMTSASRRAVVVFNGEVYNYLELRDRRPPPPGGWRTRGDTEVLVELLDGVGIRALDAMIGMFAVALWRPVERELWLIRDRLGKKPLYLTRERGRLRFASEMGALLADGTVPRETSLDRLAEFLQHGYVASPRTGIAAIEVVPPGSWLRARVQADRLVVDGGRWWRLPDPGDAPKRCATEWREELDAILRDAVRIRLRSDVPLGAFLSGGVDSSVVSLLAAQQLSRPLRTFTVDFAERAFSEGRYAAEVARSIGADHTELRLGPDALASLPELVATYGDLHGDSSALPTAALCRATRAHVTVALSGDGGDELLGGYTRYARTLRLAKIARAFPDGAALGLRYFGREVLPWWLRGAGLLGRFSDRLDTIYTREVWAWSPHRWPLVLRADRRPLARAWHDVVVRALDENRPRAPLLRMMACDVATYLPEDILVKVDRASMAHGLEVRAPLLDHRLIEHTMRADPDWVAQKAPLRAIYAERLPGAVFSRRKAGFTLPLARWWGRGLAALGADRLLDPNAQIAPLLDRSVVRRILHNRRRDESVHLWHLLVLHAWLELWRPSVAQ